MSETNGVAVFVNGRHFSCDCGYPGHALYVGPFFGDVMSEPELFNECVTFTVVVESDGLRQRIAGAIRVLLGRYELHEMVIDREQWPAFVEHVGAIDAACKRVQTRYTERRRS